jgi:hypothetical protein
MSAFGAGSFNGLAFGPGTQVHVIAVEGLDDLPPVRADDVLRPLDHGAWGGSELSGVREVVLDLGLRGATPEDLDVLVKACQSAFTVGSEDLALVVRDGAETVFGRVRRRALPYDASTLARFGRCVVEFACPDPRVFGPEATASTGLPSTPAGTGFNLGFNVGFGGAGQSGATAVLPNDGNTDGLLAVTFNAGTAALASPTLEQYGRGLLRVTGTLSAGDTLTIDPRERVVLLNGAPRYDLVSLDSTWPTLPPGGATYRFTASTTGTDATMTVTGRSARL